MASAERYPIARASDNALDSLAGLWCCAGDLTTSASWRPADACLADGWMKGHHLADRGSVEIERVSVDCDDLARHEPGSHRAIADGVRWR